MGLPILNFIVFIFFILHLASFVESQQNVNPGSPPASPRSSPPPPPPMSPPPPSPPPPSPPPPSPPPPSPPPPSPPPPSSPPPSPPPPPPPPPPPSPPPPPRKHLYNSPESHPSRRSPLPMPKQELNLGKKIGLLFLGIAAILQICVVIFLMAKRKQLLKAYDGN